MRTRRWPLSEIEAKAQSRPEGYVEALRSCAHEQSSGWMEFDLDSPCWQRLKDRYAKGGAAARERREKRRQAQVESDRLAWEKAAGRIARGVIGLTRAAVATTTGVGATKRDVIEHRLAVCDGCDHRRGQRCGRLLDSGKTCGCYIPAKVKVARAKCPLGKWDKPIEGDGNVGDVSGERTVTRPR